MTGFTVATMEASVEKMELLHGIQNIGISNPNEACLEVSTICIKANKAAASVTKTPYLLIEIDCISFLFIFICKFGTIYKYKRMFSLEVFPQAHHFHLKHK